MIDAAIIAGRVPSAIDTHNQGLILVIACHKFQHKSAACAEIARRFI